MSNEPLKIEVGKTYITETGVVVKIETMNLILQGGNNHLITYLGYHDEVKDLCYFTESGKAIPMYASSGKIDTGDLIHEVFPDDLNRGWTTGSPAATIEDIVQEYAQRYSERAKKLNTEANEVSVAVERIISTGLDFVVSLLKDKDRG